LLFRGNGDFHGDKICIAYLISTREKKLFPYIPFYITRYEKELTEEGNIENAVSDLEYFRSEMIRLHNEGELSDRETVDLMDIPI
jgi:hypothetical protein